MVNPKRNARGLTLIEVMVGTVIALLLTAAAVAFATQETRLMDVSQERLEMSMVGRSALSLLAADLRKAGAGVGYDEQNRFMGLLADNFNAGGLGWNGTGAPIPAGATPPFPGGAEFQNTFTRPRPGASSGDPYQVNTHDIGIRYADGSYATIVNERANQGRICGGPGIDFEANELVVMRDAVGISARSGQLQLSPLTTGSGCPCVGGCRPFTLNPTVDLSTGPGANTASYGHGEMQGGLATVVWFVAENGGEGELRRAEFTGNTCAARNTCGGVVADFAETLLTQIWQWNATTNQWEQAGQAPVLGNGERLRVDVEIVLRSQNETNAIKPEVQTKLAANNCVPGPCGSNQDKYTRVAYRTSVEIMNSGLVELQ